MHCSHILHVRYFRDVIFFDLFYYTLCTYGFGWSEFSRVVFCGWVQADQGRCFFWHIRFGLIGELRGSMSRRWIVHSGHSNSIQYQIEMIYICTSNIFLSQYLLSSFDPSPNCDSSRGGTDLLVRSVTHHTPVVVPSPKP